MEEMVVVVQLFLIAQLRIVPYLFSTHFRLFTSTHPHFLYNQGYSFVSSIPQNDHSYHYPLHRLRGSPSQGCWCPCHGGLLSSSCTSWSCSYLFRSRVLTSCLLCSASPSPTLRNTMVFQRVNTPLDLVRNIWPGQMTAKISTRSL